MINLSEFAPPLKHAHVDNLVYTMILYFFLFQELPFLVQLRPLKQHFLDLHLVFQFLRWPLNFVTFQFVLDLLLSDNFLGHPVVNVW